MLSVSRYISLNNSARLSLITAHVCNPLGHTMHCPWDTVHYKRHSTVRFIWHSAVSQNVKWNIEQRNPEAVRGYALKKILKWGHSVPVLVRFLVLLFSGQFPIAAGTSQEKIKVHFFLYSPLQYGPISSKNLFGGVGINLNKFTDFPAKVSILKTSVKHWEKRLRSQISLNKNWSRFNADLLNSEKILVYDSLSTLSCRLNNMHTATGSFVHIQYCH